MHTSCLGILADAIGNVLYEICLAIGGLLTAPDQGLSNLRSLLDLASRSLNGQNAPIRGVLTLGRIVRKGMPKFRGKAAECRKLLPVVYWMLKHFPCCKCSRGASRKMYNACTSDVSEHV